MSRTIFVHNKSSHPQTFEVHGWNNNKNIVIKPRSTHMINAPNGSSGAIIALHNGHEGEQAEITKNGFGGNDFFDLSNIVGAGGNMTVQQVGEPKTLKGDPLFMQHLNHAFRKASKETKDKCRGALHFDKKGDIIRLEPIKFHPEIEPLIRTFADGKTYIGVGAWNGSPGHKSDNEQSKAGHGNKDIIVTSNDGDASPDKRYGHHGAQFLAQGLVDSFESSASTGNEGEAGADEQEEADGSAEADGGAEADSGAEADGTAKANSEDETAGTIDAEDVRTNEEITAPASLSQHTLLASVAATSIHPTKGDPDDGKKSGIILHNHSKHADTYFFFDNYWNGNGTAGANFDKPLKAVSVPAGHKAFASLPLTFKGRVQRGRLIPATWVEFQLKAANDGAAHGDISVQQGNDGPATISSTDGSHQPMGGFKQPLVHKAPPAARVKRPGDGVEVLASTMGNWMGPPNKAAIDYQRPLIGKTTYVVGGTGVPDVAARNHRFSVDFY